MGKTSLIRGKSAESIAATYLRQLGYRILETNWQCKWGEIDIIGLSKQFIIVFFEVKFRSRLDYGRPIEFINYTKLRKLEKSIYFYLYSKQYLHVPCRLDGICLYYSMGRLKLRHYSNLLLDS